MEFALQHIYTGYSKLRKYCEKMVEMNGAKGPMEKASKALKRFLEKEAEKEDLLRGIQVPLNPLA
jgi:hypothetical protein